MTGYTIKTGQLGKSSHKFFWYNRYHDEFEKLTQGTLIGEAWVQWRWLFIPLEPGYVLLFGECGGKILYHLLGSKLPKKYHLYITFEDDSFLTVTTQMWGTYELCEEGEEQNRELVKGMRTTPVEPEFTYDYFSALIDELVEGKKRSAKSLLTQDQIIPGLGNAIAQDILFQARLHPRHPTSDLDIEQRRTLYDSIINTVDAVIEQGGHYDEYDLFNKRGGYMHLKDKNAVARPCPECEGEIVKIQYLGGACYLCPNCQS